MDENQVMEQSPKHEPEKAPFVRALFDFLETAVIALAVVFIIFSSGIRLCSVDGGSMLNTLHDKENLIVSNWFYTPKTGDIIVFHQTGELNKPMVKRVIATEGQFVMIDTENAYVYVSNDREFTEDEILSEPYAYLHIGFMEDRYGISGKVFEVPEGHVFVMGDNRNNSTDSRSETIGFVDERRILGKVVLRLTPFSKFGKVE